MIDIFKIEPNVVSRDLRGYSFLFYGAAKVGKTTLASKFPKSLLIAPERGYNALPGVMAAPIDSWADFVSILNQLERNKKEVDLKRLQGENDADTEFHTVVIDIVDILYDYCEKFILNKERVEKIADVPYGAGYGIVKKEFDTKLRKIVQMGYGLILISHAVLKTSDDDDKIMTASPTLSKAPKLICSRLVDILGYISIDVDESGAITHNIHTRGTLEYEAGSRFKYIPETIPLSYNALRNAIGNAIDKLAEEDGEEFVTSEFKNNYKVEDKPTFENVMNDISALILKHLDVAGVNGKEAVEKARLEISNIIEEVLGKSKKLANMDESQVELAIVIKEKLENLE